jgi:Domain of unknown function (DUF5666)
MIMTSTHLILQRAQALLRNGLFAFILAGCGGGVDSGGTGGAATYASGPITGSGSIIVNGVRFDDSAATVTDDDGGRTRSDLKLGMTVEVRGSAIDNSSGSPASTANSITFNSEMVGKIDSLNVGAQSLVVFGQTVNVKTTTVFDDSLGNGLLSLALNDVVEVYGLLDTITGQYTATRIERKSGATTQYRLRGRVSNLDGGAKEFNIGTERISYLSLAAADVPAGFANDMIVRIRVDSARTGNVWTATRLRDGANRPDEQSHARVEGLISSFNSITQFSVAGVPVTTSVTTAFPDGTTFALGDRIEVEGTMTNGVLAASKVEIETDSGDQAFDFRGPIEAVGAQTITVRSTTISIPGGVEFRPIGKSASDLVLGANVEVKATLVNGNQYQATRIEFKN